MAKKEAKFMRALRLRVMPIVLSAHKAKTHSDYQMRKVSGAKRAKKWREINTKAIREYHTWIQDELESLMKP